MTQDFNKPAYDALLQHEVAYLEANGWTRPLPDKPDLWSNRVLERTLLTHGHAVNVQKQRDRISVSGVDPQDGPKPEGGAKCPTTT